MIIQKILVSFSFIFISTFISAQKRIIDTAENTFTVIQEEAHFKNGGKEGWIKYLQENLKADLAYKYVQLPKKDTTIIIRAFVNFTVEPNGKIGKVWVENEKEVHPKLIKEAIRLIKNSPDWIPAKQAAFKESADTTLEQRMKIYGDKFYNSVQFRVRQTISWVVD